jgi:hypothetical protein
MDKIIVTDTSLLVTRQAALRRQELYTGLFTERERLLIDERKALQEVKYIATVH